ncbi:RagB/SusD family nutrient uptake outer membrane protein [Mucilaginibacter sp.]|uniref:RagB/SusD family nutrient uptake outer membrane protein n=1 Tax=Mucilaginibacter sp. TaxID=1882438 RepID=UPI0025E1B82C|nr:RagB/SusD family nutrient uptake outer membrane protein [Mucilaginibacter sp.]
MKKYKHIITTVFVAGLAMTTACKKQLDVKNPNSPTLEQAKTESGLTSLAAGSIYINGFVNGDGWLGDSFFSLCYGFHELLADDVSAQAANQNVNLVNVPDYAILDDGTKVVNTQPQIANLRLNNTRDKQSQNMFYYEWQSMYGLNNACNQILALAGTVPLSGDAGTKLATYKAWAYWWKGYAYARLGSVYYAGIINNGISATNATYVNSAALIAESNKNLQQAASILSGITANDTYTALMGKLIPSFFQAGNAQVPTPAMFVRSINTLMARNLLANTRTSVMTAANWQAVLALANTGIQASDNVFAGFTTTNNYIFSPGGGSVAANTSGDETASSFTISERLVQDIKPNDKRLAENFLQVTPFFNQVGGFTFSTRWKLYDAKIDVVPHNGAIQLADKTPGNQEVYIGPSYEENELMKAEALINTGQIELGLASIENVRDYQGAGLPKVTNTGLNLAQALEELRKERRLALLFRGTAFYDARRWGVIYDISEGGGRTNAVVLSPNGVLSTHATINYNFLDYWDVPADEFVLNPPGAGSAPVLNPKK